MDKSGAAPHPQRPGSNRTTPNRPRDGTLWRRIRQPGLSGSAIIKLKRREENRRVQEANFANPNIWVRDNQNALDKRHGTNKVVSMKPFTPRSRV
jgi:hypothetical protein